MREFVHIGHGNYVKRSLITTVTHFTNNITVRNERAILEREGFVLRMGHGRVVRSVIALGTGHIVLSAQPPEEITMRMKH